MKQEFGVEREKNSIWMTWKDIKNKFSQVIICKVYEEKED